MNRRRTTRALATTLVVGTAIGVLPAWATLSAEHSYPGNRAMSDRPQQPTIVPVAVPLAVPAPAAAMPEPVVVTPPPVPAPAPQPTPEAQPAPQPVRSAPPSLEPLVLAPTPEPVALPPRELLELWAFLTAQAKATTDPAPVAAPVIAPVTFPEVSLPWFG